MIPEDDDMQATILEVIAWFYDQIYDGTSVPHAIAEAEATYAASHGVDEPREVSDFIQSRIAEVT